MLAVTNDDETNLAIAIAVRLLNPGIPVIAAPSESRSPPTWPFGTDHIINPYERFADSLALAVAAPGSVSADRTAHRLPETPLAEPHQPPHGHWILCGFGCFGHAVAERLRNTGIG